MSSVFDVERQALSTRVLTEKIAQSFFGVTATLSLLTPFVVPTSKPVSGMLWGYSFFTGLSFSVMCQLGKRQQKILDSLERSDLDQLKVELTNEGSLAQIESQINNKLDLVKKLNALPIQQRIAFAQQYNLMEFIELPEQQPVEVGAENQFDFGSPIAGGFAQDNMASSAQASQAQSDIQWLIDIVNDTITKGERKNHHFMVFGASQTGKSTLVSALLLLIAQKCQSVFGYVPSVNLIDPKFPMTPWVLPPSYKGYEQVYEGLKRACDVLDTRKKLALEAAENGKKIPQQELYVTIVDEQDTIFGEGEGYSTVIPKETAKDIVAMEKRLLKESAAYNMLVVVIGQNPNSKTSGFSRQDYNSSTMIVTGAKNSRLWIEDGSYSGDKNKKPELLGQLQILEQDQKRQCLVCPARGGNFITELSPILRDIVINHSQRDPIPVLLEWINSLSSIPPDSAILEKWFELTQTNLNPEELAELKQRLEIDDVF